MMAREREEHLGLPLLDEDSRRVRTRVRVKRNDSVEEVQAGRLLFRILWVEDQVDDWVMDEGTCITCAFSQNLYYGMTIHRFSEISIINFTSFRRDMLPSRYASLIIPKSNHAPKWWMRPSDEESQRQAPYARS